jgi:TetR/AcrR family transcriptional repressor of nem operon
MSPKVEVNQKQDTRNALIEAGIDIMCVKGYTNTGIQEVLSSLGVPKGSFYYYFGSKEDFALAIIEYYAKFHSEKVLQFLRNTDKLPLERLKDFCVAVGERLRQNQCRKGCFIGTLSSEMADQSEALREALAKVMSKWRDLYTSCIQEGQLAGEITNEVAAEKLAELFLSGWEGAVMRAKTTKDLDPINTFIELMFEHVLKP